MIKFQFPRSWLKIRSVLLLLHEVLVWDCLRCIRWTIPPEFCRLRFRAWKHGMLFRIICYWSVLISRSLYWLLTRICNHDISKSFINFCIVECFWNWVVHALRLTIPICDHFIKHRGRNIQTLYRFSRYQCKPFVFSYTMLLIFLLECMIKHLALAQVDLWSHILLLRLNVVPHSCLCLWQCLILWCRYFYSFISRFWKLRICLDNLDLIFRSVLSWSVRLYLCLIRLHRFWCCWLHASIRNVIGFNLKELRSLRWEFVLFSQNLYFIMHLFNFLFNCD